MAYSLDLSGRVARVTAASGDGSNPGIFQGFGFTPIPAFVLEPLSLQYLP